MKKLILIVCLLCVGCSPKYHATNTRFFKRDMHNFNKLEAMRVPSDFDIAALARKMIGPIPTTQFEWQGRKKLQSIWGKYLP